MSASAPERAWALARFTLDAAMLVTAGCRGDAGRSAAGVPAPPGQWLLVFGLFVAGLFAARGMYGSRLRFELLEDSGSSSSSTSLAAMAVLSARELVGDRRTSRRR